MVDYWSVVVDCLRSKVKGLNPLQIYNLKQAMSSILTIIFLHIFYKNPQRSQIHRFTCSRGVVGVIGKIGKIKLDALHWVELGSSG